MNPKKYFAKNTRTRIQRVQMKRRLVNILGGKCIDCGYNQHLAALDFDHINPKTKNFGIANKLGFLDFLDLLVEVKKCVLRCANCHRIKSHPDATA